MNKRCRRCSPLRGSPSVALVRRSVRGRRNLDIAALGAQVGGTYATTAARKLFATAERRVELDRERELRTADAITERLGNMKGRVDEARPDGQLRQRRIAGADARSRWPNCSRTRHR